MDEEELAPRSQDALDQVSQCLPNKRRAVSDSMPMQGLMHCVREAPQTHCAIYPLLGCGQEVQRVRVDKPQVWLIAEPGPGEREHLGAEVNQCEGLRFDLIEKQSRDSTGPGTELK